MQKKIYLLFIFLFFFFLRLIPYFHDQVPTGYDAGIYLYILKTFPHIPSWIISSYYSAFFYILFPFLQGKVFTESIILLALSVQIFLLYCIFFGVKRIANWQTALLTIFFLTTSPIQIRTYWFFYLKYIVSIGFFILFLSSLGKKAYAKATCFGILTGITHLLTGGIMILVCVIELAITKQERVKKLMYIIIMLGSILLFYLPVFNQSILFHTNLSFDNFLNASETVRENSGGTFYTPYISLLLTMLYLPLAIFGIKKILKENQEVYRPFLITTILTVLLIILQVSFFKRIVIITDIMFLIFASVGFSLVKEIKYLYMAILIIFAILFSIKTSDKLITPSQFTELAKTKQITQNHYVLSTAKEDTAWLLGYTNAHIIAWNYGGYDTYWNNEQWRNFFDPFYPIEKKILLFKLLPPHSFIYISDHTKTQLPQLIKTPYLIPISAHIYRITNPRE